MSDIDVLKLSDPERLALAKRMASEIRDALPKSIHAGEFTLKSKLPYKASSFREVLIHRASDLADVAIDLYESNRLVPAFVLTRAVIETTAVLFWLHKKAERFVETHDEKAFDEFLMKGLMGSKDGTTNHESHNVLTAVDHLDKEFPGLRDMYNSLCEFTHPNWSGAMGAYSELEKEKYVLHLGKEHRPPALALGLAPLIGALSMFAHYYNELAAVIQSINDHYANDTPAV